MNRKRPVDEIEPTKSPGLAGASGADIERAVEIARDVHDARVMRELRTTLDRLTEQHDKRTLKRKHVLALLRTISEGLDPATQRPIGALDTGEMLVRSHPAIELLDEFVDAISDLDKGKTDPSLKASSHGPNASLTTKERKWLKVLLDTVLIVQRHKGYQTRSRAELFLAQKLTKAGKKWRSKVITRGRLKQLRDDYKEIT